MKPNRDQQREQADARLLVFEGRRGWQAGTLVPALLLIFIGVWILGSWRELHETGETVAKVDFRVFWAAARLAVLGSPLEALSIDSLANTHGVVDGEWMPWAYPAGFLVALMPLGTMSFSAAWLVFTIVSIGAVLIAFRPFSSGVIPVWLGFAIAPAILPNLMMGQTSILWSAGIVGALALIRADKLILAGIVIGLLTLKPQLGILIPIALIASAAWPTFISAAITTIMISVFATFVVGIEYWSEMFNMMQAHFDNIRDASEQNTLMISAFSTFSSFGLPDRVALLLQWTTTSLAAVMVFVTWRSPKISFDLRAATLLLGIVSSTPYLWFYESALLAPAALFMVRAGILGSNTSGMILTALMWLGIAPAFLLRVFSDLSDVSMRLAFAPVTLAAIIVCVQAIARQLRAPECTPLRS
ncbi:glycosyltransferase family 87 protein [Ruegeria sp. Ofav3-42]|uniref:glycosyltransferase family 87 protein n=1 Tax=Ruegeria sp. Ofav3-42 TaxID=2917759 RepID=UPI001EF52006|nr:glycosyltransferase family 87 protein [Ruegeria sp. Ofav3-42]MCG7521219.1 DUF2029 domain-containing protein [Ruegeria sp. Ofav3-42]